MAAGERNDGAWRAFVAGERSEPPVGLRWPGTLGDEDEEPTWDAFRPADDAVLACTCEAWAATNGRHWLILFAGAGEREAVHLRLPTDRYEYVPVDPAAGRCGEPRRMIVADTVHLTVPPFDRATLLWLRTVIEPESERR